MLFPVTSLYIFVVCQFLGSSTKFTDLFLAFLLFLLTKTLPESGIYICFTLRLFISPFSFPLSSISFTFPFPFCADLFDFLYIFHHFSFQFSPEVLQIPTEPPPASATKSEVVVSTDLHFFSCSITLVISSESLQIPTEPATSATTAEVPSTI